MNKPMIKLLPFAVAAVMPVAAHAEGPIDGSVYGKVNVTIENQDEGGDSVVALESNASRLGFKGKTQLNGSLYAIYQLEYEVAADDGSDVFKQRNIYVGLAGDFGAVIAGKHDTPTKLLQNKIDLFNDLKGDIKNVITKSDNRASNIVMYSTPEAGGFFAQGAAIMSEDADIDNGFSVAAGWQNDMFYAGLAYDDAVYAEDSNVLRGVVQARLGDFQLGALYETDDTNGTTNDGWVLSGQYKLGDWALKAQVGQSDIKAEGVETFSLGVDYKLAKSTKVFAFYTDDTADQDIIERNYLGLGLEHKF
jgi:predicted porin